jgi:hypothetical protein
MREGPWRIPGWLFVRGELRLRNQRSHQQYGIEFALPTSSVPEAPGKQCVRGDLRGHRNRCCVVVVYHSFI